MEALINFIDNNGTWTINARVFHQFLEVGTDFTEWCKRMFDHGFEQDKDFTPILGKSAGGLPSTDYAPTMDCAKEISMIQWTYLKNKP